MALSSAAPAVAPTTAPATTATAVPVPPPIFPPAAAPAAPAVQAMPARPAAPDFTTQDAARMKEMQDRRAARHAATCRRSPAEAARDLPRPAAGRPW